MSSANSYVTGSAWRRLVEEKKAAFENSGFDLFTVEQNEERFREYFEDLCRDLLEPFYTPLLVKLNFYRVNELASVLDAIDQLRPPLNLVTLVWGSAFIAIKIGVNCHDDLDDIVELVGRLNDSIPRLRPSEATRFPYDTALRAPLYNILDKYADTLLLIILQIQSERSGQSYDNSKSIEAPLRAAAELFNREGEIFKQQIERAISTNAQHISSGPSSYGRNAVNENTARFQVLGILGRGSEGDVYEVKEVTTGDLMGHPSVDDRVIKQVKNEVAVMQRLKHTHIASIAFWLSETSACSIFMTPRADSNLGGFLESCSKADYPIDALQSIIPWFGCLLHALWFAHGQNIAHRDIKPSNVLVKAGHIYLADFGEAKDTTEVENTQTDDDHVRGTPVYRAPEVKTGYKSQLPADIFSLGCVFSEMLTILAKRSMKEYQDFRRMPQADYPLAFRANPDKARLWLRKLDVDDSVYDPSVFLIKRMILEIPDERWTAEPLRNWLVNARTDAKFSCGYH